MLLLEGYDCFLLDLDGVPYRGPEPIPGGADAVAALRGAGNTQPGPLGPARCTP